MKKRAMNLLLIFTILLGVCPTVTMASGNQAGPITFDKIHTYTNGQFSDVKPSAWYEKYVNSAYELGLMVGSSNTKFNPDGNVTIAETLVLAWKFSTAYNDYEYTIEPGNPWYQPYVDYALEFGIIKTEQYSNYNVPATRTQFVNILAASVPSSALSPINSIDQIPDVKPTEQFAPAIYNFYNAGLLAGNDEYGTFNPNSTIKRSEVSTIVTLLATPSMRKTFELKKVINAESISITRTDVPLYVGSTAKLTTYIEPYGADGVAWKSSDSSVASVAANGVVTAKKVGTAIITATTRNGLSASCKVKVLQKSSIDVASVQFAGLNSVDGAEMIIYWRNNSNKTINYINFYVRVYDLNGRILADEIDGSTYFNCYSTGPFSPTKVEEYYYCGDESTSSMTGFASLYPSEDDGEYSVGLSYPAQYVPPENTVFSYQQAYWEAFMYNGRASDVKLHKIVVEYSDGTTETINNPSVGAHTSPESDAHYTYYQNQIQTQLKLYGGCSVNGHSFVGPTCTEDGVCAVCGATLPALGHTTDNGECERCGYNTAKTLTFSGHGNETITGINLGPGNYHVEVALSSTENGLFHAKGYDSEGYCFSLLHSIHAGQHFSIWTSCWDMVDGCVEIEADDGIKWVMTISPRNDDLW